MLDPGGVMQGDAHIPTVSLRLGLLFVGERWFRIWWFLFQYGLCWESGGHDGLMWRCSRCSGKVWFFDV
jgi:hypothetical protein